MVIETAMPCAWGSFPSKSGRAAGSSTRWGERGLKRIDSDGFSGVEPLTVDLWVRAVACDWL